MDAQLEQHVETCLVYVIKDFETVPLRTDEDLEQLRLAYLAIITGDAEGIVIKRLKDKAIFHNGMYKDVATIFSIKDPENAKKVQEMLKEELWKRADELQKMKSGKVKKAFLSNWNKIQKLTTELEVIRKKSHELRQKIKELRSFKL